MSAADLEQRVRLAAFDRLRELAAATGDGVRSRAVLLAPIEVDAERIPLVSPAAAVSSADPSAGVPRYGDQVVEGLQRYDYRHAAFDRQLVGVDPRFQLHVRRDVLDDADGPMLRHGLQGLAGRTLQLPRQRRDRPDPGFLDARYEQFCHAEPG